MNRLLMGVMFTWANNEHSNLILAVYIFINISILGRIGKGDLKFLKMWKSGEKCVGKSYVRIGNKLNFSFYGCKICYEINVHKSLGLTQRDLEKQTELLLVNPGESDKTVEESVNKICKRIKIYMGLWDLIRFRH